jgi:hypothetical protein
VAPNVLPADVFFTDISCHKTDSLIPCAYVSPLPRPASFKIREQVCTVLLQRFLAQRICYYYYYYYVVVVVVVVIIV